MCGGTFESLYLLMGKPIERIANANYHIIFIRAFGERGAMGGDTGQVSSFSSSTSSMTLSLYISKPKSGGPCLDWLCLPLVSVSAGCNGCIINHQHPQTPGGHDRRPWGWPAVVALLGCACHRPHDWAGLRHPHFWSVPVSSLTPGTCPSFSAHRHSFDLSPRSL